MNLALCLNLMRFLHHVIGSVLLFGSTEINATFPFRRNHHNHIRPAPTPKNKEYYEKKARTHEAMRQSMNDQARRESEAYDAAINGVVLDDMDDRDFAGLKTKIKGIKDVLPDLNEDETIAVYKTLCDTYYILSKQGSSQGPESTKNVQKDNEYIKLCAALAEMSVDEDDDGLLEPDRRRIKYSLEHNTGLLFRGHAAPLLDDLVKYENKEVGLDIIDKDVDEIIPRSVGRAR